MQLLPFSGQIGCGRFVLVADWLRADVAAIMVWLVVPFLQIVKTNHFFFCLQSSFLLWDAFTQREGESRKRALHPKARGNLSQRGLLLFRPPLSRMN